MTESDARVAVLGAGSWGTALSILLINNGHRTVLWGRSADRVCDIVRTRLNRAYLPDLRLPDALTVTSDLEAAVGEAHDVLVVVPGRAYRVLLGRLAHHVRPGARIACAAKGFEIGSGALLHEVHDEVLGKRNPYAVISGPTFAGEVAAGLPAAITVASWTAGVADAFAERLRGRRFRVYTSDDVIGLEVGGTVKNVLAIAAGIADGLGFGASTRAALIARGLQEIRRLCIDLGGRAETVMGLAGLDDLVLTCTDDQSRNRRMGLALARGLSVADGERAIGQVVEGVSTTAEVARVARARGVEMPICEQVNRVLQGDASPREAVRSLLARAAGPEMRIAGSDTGGVSVEPE